MCWPTRQSMMWRLNTSSWALYALLFPLPPSSYSPCSPALFLSGLWCFWSYLEVLLQAAWPLHGITGWLRWKGPLGVIWSSTPAQAGPLRTSCAGPCPDFIWIPARMKIAQPSWATHLGSRCICGVTFLAVVALSASPFSGSRVSLQGRNGSVPILPLGWWDACSGMLPALSGRGLHWQHRWAGVESSCGVLLAFGKMAKSARGRLCVCVCVCVCSLPGAEPWWGQLWHHCHPALSPERRTWEVKPGL